MKMDSELAILNKKTGEILGDYNPKEARKQPYRYYLTFYAALTRAKISLTATMQVILGQMDGKNQISLHKQRLKILANNYDISINALKISISRMRRDNLIIRISPALYFANPYYFSKSNIANIENLRREYSEQLFATQKQKKSNKKELPENVIKLYATQN
jgi:hypothetical protein